MYLNSVHIIISITITLSQSIVKHALKHTTIHKTNMHDAHNNNTCNKSFHTQNYHFDIIFQDLRTSL